VGRRVYSFSRLSGSYAIVRLNPDAPVPASVLDAAGFVSITRTDDELSIVCDEALAPPGARSECGWVVLKLHGPFAFDELGILASCVIPLAQHGVSVFTVSTFETDYILVKAAQADAAVVALRTAGHLLEKAPHR
jgi:hypothetical protein